MRVTRLADVHSNLEALLAGADTCGPGDRQEDQQLGGRLAVRNPLR